MSDTAQSRSKGGLPFALGAYAIWGFLPLYLSLLSHVPPLEFVGWRIIFTLPVCLALVALLGQRRELLAALASWRLVLLLLASAVLIAVNWLIYAIAIQQGHVYAASLGYYINPLVNVLIGTLVLGERLSRLQWWAVSIAAAGISPLVWDGLDTLLVSLSLALSFGGYGLVRKLTPVGSLPGLTIETALLILPAIGIAAWFAAGTDGSSMGADMQTSVLLGLSGAITAAALLLFAVAARRMSYSALGFVQFLGPSLAFLQGMLVFKEPLHTAQLTSFVAIWLAIALFCWDLWLRRDLIRAG